MLPFISFRASAANSPLTTVLPIITNPNVGVLGVALVVVNLRFPKLIVEKLAKKLVVEISLYKLIVLLSVTLLPLAFRVVTVIEPPVFMFKVLVPKTFIVIAVIEPLPVFKVLGFEALLLTFIVVAFIVVAPKFTIILLGLVLVIFIVVAFIVPGFSVIFVKIFNIPLVPDNANISTFKLILPLLETLTVVCPGDERADCPILFWHCR